ncbi:MAG: hypothetical protein NVS9B1_00380 [Candidatus Dormibacteraceae bacterium]
MDGEYVTKSDSGLVISELADLELLYETHKRQAYSLALRIVGDAGHAEDVVQQAFLKVWNSAAGFDPARASVRTWLLRIVRNTALDQRRRGAGRWDRERSIELQMPAGYGVEDPWPAVDDRLANEQVRRAVDALPADQRRVVELAYYEGYSGPEIAELCGVPLSTVKGRIRLALEKVGAHVDGWLDAGRSAGAPVRPLGRPRLTT